jgi:hypothetical protein
MINDVAEKARRVLHRSYGIQFALVLVIAHACISWVLYLNHALIPDELIFLTNAGEKFQQLNGRLNPFLIDNAFGYGSLYSLIHFCFYYFPDPQLSARFFYWAILLASDLLILAIIVKRYRNYSGIVVLFLLALPMVWWQGKITGPEPLSNFFAIASIFAAYFSKEYYKKTIISGALLGLSVGIKLTSLPILFFLAAVLWDQQEPERKIIQPIKLVSSLLIACMVGYVLANPYLLHDVTSVFSNYYLPKTATSNSISKMLWGDGNVFWEVTPQGSFTFFSMPLSLMGILVMCGVLNKGSRSFTIGWLASVFAVLILGSRTPNFFGWYFYTVIFFLPFLIPPPQPQNDDQQNTWPDQLTAFALVIVISLTAAINFQTILNMVSNKLNHIHQLEVRQSITTYANTLIKEYGTDLVVDFSEYNLIALNAAELSKEGVRSVGVNELRKYEGFDWMWGFAIQKWVPPDKDGNLLGCQKLLNSKKVLIMAGERLISHRDIWQVSFRDWAKENIEGNCPGWELKFYNFHERIHYLVFEKKGQDTVTRISQRANAKFDLRHAITINSSPTFENETAWNGRLQRGPRGKGVIVGPGADNPNVLSQRILVRPFEQINVVARAASASKPSGTGRLQINWVGADDQFISSSIKVIDLSNKLQKFEATIVAPAGAQAGILYVAPHTANDILLYSEMRVLGMKQVAE